MELNSISDIKAHAKGNRNYTKQNVLTEQLLYRDDGNSYPILLEKLSATGFSSLPVQEILLTPSSPLRLIVKNPSRKVNTISRESLFETEQQTG